LSLAACVKSTLIDTETKSDKLKILVVCQLGGKGLYLHFSCTRNRWWFRSLRRRNCHWKSSWLHRMCLCCPAGMYPICGRWKCCRQANTEQREPDQCLTNWTCTDRSNFVPFYTLR